MPSPVLHAQAQKFLRKVPDVQPGYTVRVHERIQEGSKERVQVFEGLVISVHNGHVPTDRSFTVRRVFSGIGVEKVFALHSPNIEKVEVKKIAKARRAKLFFIRGRTGKAARLNERFTTDNEFALPEDDKPVEAASEEIVEAVATEEEVQAEPEASEKKEEEATKE